MSRRRSKGSRADRAKATASRTRELSPADQKTLIQTALDLIETLYVHLPLKRSMYAVNPLQRLKLLRRRSDVQVPPLQKREFFNELLTIFCQLRDLHTNFVLPEPSRSRYAFLPFELERCVRDSGDVAWRHKSQCVLRYTKGVLLLSKLLLEPAAVHRCESRVGKFRLVFQRQ